MLGITEKVQNTAKEEKETLMANYLDAYAKLERLNHDLYVFLVKAHALQKRGEKPPETEIAHFRETSVAIQKVFVQIEAHTQGEEAA